MPKLEPCENPNCGNVCKKLERAEVKEGSLRLCSSCYSYARKHRKLRTAELVQRAEEMKEYMKEDVHTCENSNCGKMCKQLIRAEVKEGSLRLCRSCYCYARKHRKLRSAEMVVIAHNVKETRQSRGVRCHNAHCRTTYLDKGGYGRDNGKFYCKLCVSYLNEHGTERPRRLVDAQMRRESTGKGYGECQNPHCMKVVQDLIRYELKEEGWMRLCKRCYQHARTYHELRTEDEVRKSDEMRRKRKLHDRCFNDNCRTTELEGGRYGKYNNEFYCEACAQYVNKHNGEERPRELVESSTVTKEECENPDCDVLTTRLIRSEIEDGGILRLCKWCYQYARRTGKLRSAELVKRAENAKKRKLGVLQCHNENCKDTNFGYGCYAKCNGEYYCQACGQYIDLHGEERPLKLVEEQRLYKSRYMWQLRHPKLPEE